MRKEITKDGNSHKIRITSEDLRNYNLQEGDLVELTITKIEDKPKKK